MQKVLVIEGMMCKHCQKRVEDALTKVEGVKEVIIDLDYEKNIWIIDWNHVRRKYYGTRGGGSYTSSRFYYGNPTCKKRSYRKE